MMLVEEVKRTGLDYGMFERIRESWTWWKEYVPAPSRIRIIGDDDSDGVTSAFQVAAAMRRADYDVDVKIMPIHSPDDVGEAFDEPRDGFVILDSGSSVLDAIDSYKVPTLVLDHHRVRDLRVEHTFEVNPRRIGGDRVRHASTSILAALFAIEAGNHWDVSFAGVVGAISDRQHLGGFDGLVGYVASGALRQGVLVSSPGFTLVGDTVEQAIAQSIDPFFDQLTGHSEAVRNLLQRLHLPPNARPLDIVGAAAKQLVDALQELLATRGVVVERLPPLLGERYALNHTSGVPTVFAMAQLMEALTAAKAHETALKVLAGDASAARRARLIQQKRVEGILKELARLRLKVEERKNVRWVETFDGANTGVYAHTLLTFVYGDDKPFVVVTHSDDEAKCSARGSPRLYHAGLDLSIAMGRAAEAVGGHGGGHPGASGATVPYARRDEFLDHLDRVLGELRRGSGP